MKKVMKDIFLESYKGYFLETDVQYLEKLHELHNDVPFLHERLKIEQVEKVAANLLNKAEYVIHIRNFKEPFNHG